MIIYKSLLYILIPILSGIFLTHLIWQERDSKSILLKVFLGTGIGIGVNSLFYFIYLLLFNHRSGYFIFQISYLIILVIIIFFREKNALRSFKNFVLPSRLQIFFLAITGVMITFALSIFFTTATRNLYGQWDAWAIYNRTARFIFRGDVQWKNAFSPELDGSFHADYPPLIALNVASGWDALNKENSYIPMIIGGVFLFGCVGLLFSGLSMYKNLGQASLATGMLLSVTGYVKMGAAQMTDIPLSFFILATGILLFVYSIKKQKELLVLAGLVVGLASWTKNEGIIFMLASSFALLLVYRSRLSKILPWYLLGSILPITIVVLFKTTLAPSGDLFVDLPQQIYQAINLSRHQEILKSFWSNVMSWGNWQLLVLYMLFLGINVDNKNKSAIKIVFIMFILQLAAYYSIFLITPHPLTWHLSTALSRILLQVVPLFFFLYFSIVKAPEKIFETIKVDRE